MGCGPVGEGQFAVAEDRAKLAPMLLPLLERKLLRCLRAQDLVGYRLVLNQQSVYLRGLKLGDFCKPIPGFEHQGKHPLVVEEFLYQNGFTTISERDSAGWLPLHYAALSGNATLIEGLLAIRANPSAKTKRDQPLLGLPPLTSALAIAVFWQHYDATRLLISAKASLSGGICTPLIAACRANSPLGIRTLCEARCDPSQRNLLGNDAFYAACSHGALEAMEELYLQRGGCGIDMTHALLSAMATNGGSAELVQRLVHLRADVNDQTFTWWSLSTCMGLVFAYKALQHRFGKKTLLTKLSHHNGYRTTPLMLAIITSQFEAAAALVAAGARLDLKNSYGYSAEDFAEGHPLPDFLQEAFEGRPEGCKRVTSIAINDSVVEL